MMETAVVVSSLQKNLATLRERVEALEVKTPEDYVVISNLIVEGRAFVRRWEEIDGPGIASARDHLDLLRNEHKGHVTAAELIIAVAIDKKEKYAAAERQKAQLEQQRINDAAVKEARKKHAAAPPPVTVAPNLPTTAGVKNQVYYFAECQDEDKLIRAFLTAGPKERAFLRQFIQADQQAIGKFARDTKDNDKTQAAIPGVNAWSKG